MQITAPYGYHEIVPFMQDQRVKRLPENTLPEFALNINSLPLSLAEVPEACADYPLVFVPQKDGTFILVAILGVADRENLFVTDGTWRESTYIPAYVRRYPFCMTRVTLDGVRQNQRLVCVEKEFITPDGVSMFDGQGNQTPQWVRFLEFMNQYETDVEATLKFCAVVRDFKLLEPMSMQASVGNQNMSLNGMYRINFTRMETLNSSEIKTLYKNGTLGSIYHIIGSLNRFQRIFELKAKRMNAGASATGAPAAEAPAVAAG
jgi:hypothetical protein